MGVLTASNESPERDVKHFSDPDSEYYSSGEDTRLLQKEKGPSEKKPYPKSVFFIVGNEFCERFTYYGLRTVLTLYLTRRLYYTEDAATMIYHLFTMIAYFTPVFGAMIADSLLGKFRTILYLSILYTIGAAVLSFGAFPNPLETMKIVSIVGLVIIGIGTGGIKPCVSAFGGDQFKEGQEKQLQRFFSVFYLSINLGSVFSTILTPILREDVHCLGEKTCFPVAFGVPAVLMVVALLLFVCGKPLYTINPPEGNIVFQVSKCIWYAVGKKCKSSEKKREHFLDYADDKFDKKLIADIKILFHVLVLYIPLPVFWALFDQLGSRWTLQATRMDGELLGYHIKADQMQVINPFLIIAFIPLFDYVIYPLLNKCRLLTKPLQRITTGGFLAASSFILAGFVELSLESGYPTMPSPGFSQLSIINNSPCGVKIEAADISGIPAFGSEIKELPLEQTFTWSFVTDENCRVSGTYNMTFDTAMEIESMMISLLNDNLIVQKQDDTKEKSENGEPQVRIFYNIDKSQTTNVRFLLKEKKKASMYFIDTKSPYTVGVTNYTQVPPGEYSIYVPYNNTEFLETPIADIHFKTGAIDIISIYYKEAEQVKNAFEFEMVMGNFVSILHQIPQYLVITAGEIMFSITGLEFSYSQAPTSMKSVIQAAWLLTVAFGNLIVMVIAKAKIFDKQSYELFFFAILMGIDMVIFGILAYFYKYVNIPTKNNTSESSPKGSSNDAYVEETDFNK